MARRVRLEQHRGPEDVAPAAERPQPQPGPAPSSPETVLALQRSAGNQAAMAVLARMGNDTDEEDETVSGGGIGAYLYSWVTYLGSFIPGRSTPATTGTVTAEPETEVTAQTEPASPAVTMVQTPTPTVPQTPPQPSPAPSIAPPTPATRTRLSDGTITELRTESRKLHSKLERVVLADKAAREIRHVCHLIDHVVETKAITDAEYTEVTQAIKGAWDVLAKAPKAKEASDETTSGEKAASAPKALPVHVLYGETIGADPAGWGTYRGTVTKVIQEMRNGGVTLGTDFKPRPHLSVIAHWQPGEGQHFIKVQLDAEDVGKGSVTRGYFRYKIFTDRIVLKFVAIRTEHKGGANTTLYGDHRDVVNEDGT